MTIYQVVDEKNFTVDEYQHRDMALLFSEDMTAWFPEHFYHIEVLVFEEPGAQIQMAGKLIYSKWPGYIDRIRVDINEWCSSNNLDFQIQHTSGHADTQTLVRPAQAVSAKRVIPIHGFALERLCELIANTIQIDDGEWIII